MQYGGHNLWLIQLIDVLERRKGLKKGAVTILDFW